MGISDKMKWNCHMFLPLLKWNRFDLHLMLSFGGKPLTQSVGFASLLCNTWVLCLVFFVITSSLFLLLSIILSNSNYRSKNNVPTLYKKSTSKIGLLLFSNSFPTMKNCSEKFCFLFDHQRKFDSEMDSIKWDSNFFLNCLLFCQTVNSVWNRGYSVYWTGYTQNEDFW